jgi:hypothetical protein
MLYWSGTTWQQVDVPGNAGDVSLRLCRGVPMWVGSCPPPPAVWAFSKDFTSYSVDGNLLESLSGTFEFLADGAHRTASTVDLLNQYIRTVDTNFATRDFIFETAFTFFSAGNGHVLYVGMGSGDPDPSFYNSPQNSLMIRFHRGYFGGDVRVSVATTGMPIDIAIPGNFPQDTSPTMYTARIIKSGNSVTFEVETSTGTIRHVVTDFAGAAPFLNNQNTRLFVGNHVYGVWRSFAVREP